MNDEQHYTQELEELLHEVQADLWYDLENAIRLAINGVWSIGTESVLQRIWEIARKVGFTDWERVPYPLLTSGVYQEVLKAHNEPIPDMDLENSDYIRKNNLWRYKDLWAQTREEISKMNWED